jgi:hypothetical protein
MSAKSAMAALGADHVFGDRRLGNLEPELEQFTMDARGAPQWVLLAHPLDEFAQLTANSGPPWPTARFPTPIGPKPRSMPPQDRVRLNDVGQTEQAWPEPRRPTMCNGGASKSKSAEALRPSTVRSVGASASTATGTWDNRRLPHQREHPFGGDCKADRTGSNSSSLCERDSLHRLSSMTPNSVHSQVKS